MNSTSHTMLWLKEKFKNEKLISQEEEMELFKLAKAGNKLARDRILTAHMRFVIQVAREFSNGTLATEELVNEGAIGLWHAIDLFDTSRGHRFITYAVWWIKASITRAISEKGSLVRLPLNQQIKLHKELQKAAQGKLLSDEIKELNAIGSRQTSLNEPLEDGSSLKLEDILKDEHAVSPDEIHQKELVHNFTNKLLKKVPPREREILSAIYGLNGVDQKSIRDASFANGISRERVRQLRDQGMTRLRQLNSDGHLDQTARELMG